MARHTKEWNEGYQAALEAIKKSLEGKDSGDGKGGSANNLPSDMQQPPTSKGKGKGKGTDADNKGEQNSNQGGSNSRSNPNDDSQGIVRPEDCGGSDGVDDMPDTAGGFFGKEDGDKLAKSEGYDTDGAGDKTIEREWKDAALKAASKIDSDPKKAGKGFGSLKSTIDSLYKVSTDWKKAFNFVVGKAINDQEQRKGFSNKNILASQGRHARTNKDKYDCPDYMIAFIDSSGSLSLEQLKYIISEVYALALVHKPLKMYVIQCDTQIRDVQCYNSPEEIKRSMKNLQVHGGGGTAMKPLWELLRTDKRFKGTVPDLITIFTDGYLWGDEKSGNTITLRRDRKTMNWLCWVVLDNPSCQVENEARTRIIHLKSSDIKH